MRGDGRRSEAGFSTPLLVLMLGFMVLLLGGLSVDLWRVLAEHREVAGLVDGASIAGSTAIDLDFVRDNPSVPEPPLLPELAIDRACRYLEDHGDITACPTPDAEVVVAADTITVTVTRDVELTFLAALVTLDPSADTSPIRVSAEGVGRALRGGP